MVESIGPRLVSADRGMTRAGAPSAATAPTPASTAPVPTSNDPATRLSGVASTLAATPPIDTERVERIKRAIADGSFPILPATIADRLLALRLDWIARDPA